MPISDKKRRRFQLAGSILMLLGVMFNLYRYFFTTDSSWTQIMLAICWFPLVIIFYLQSRDIIKTAKK